MQPRKELFVEIWRTDVSHFHHGALNMQLVTQALSYSAGTLGCADAAAGWGGGGSRQIPGSSGSHRLFSGSSHRRECSEALGRGLPRGGPEQTGLLGEQAGGRGAAQKCLSGGMASVEVSDWLQLAAIGVKDQQLHPPPPHESS